MSISSPSPHSELLTLASARELLKVFVDCPGSRPRVELDHVDRDQVRQALLLLVAESSYQTLGICADTADQAFQALGEYLVAFGYHWDQDAQTVQVLQTEITGSVYVKFNTRTGSCYLDRYGGLDRGVLVTCQSEYDSEAVGTYGHVPLNLFAEAVAGDGAV